MRTGPIYEYIELGDKKVPVKIEKQVRMKGQTGSSLHWHEALEFYFVLGGGVEVLCNGEKEWLYSGDTGYISWCEMHKGTDFLDNTVFLTVQIDLSSLEKLEAEDNANPLFMSSKTLPTYIRSDEKLIQMAVALQKTYGQEGLSAMYMAKSVIYQILAHLLTLEDGIEAEKSVIASPTVKLVRSTLFYISGHYNERLSLEKLAKEKGVTKQHLSKVFKQHTGQTVHQYINEFRCHNALSLIQDGVSYSEAAYMVGYEDYNYFSRVFKGVFGCSPRHYLTSGLN